MIMIFILLPRDAMLAQYMLSSCIHPSVCLSACMLQVRALSRWLNLR